jgi:hypothetical protein
VFRVSFWGVWGWVPIGCLARRFGVYGVLSSAQGTRIIRVFQHVALGYRAPTGCVACRFTGPVQTDGGSGLPGTSAWWPVVTRHMVYKAQVYVPICPHVPQYFYRLVICLATLMRTNLSENIFMLPIYCTQPNKAKWGRWVYEGVR